MSHHIDLSIPKQVQANAKKGLDLHQQHGFGGTEVGEHMAEQLAAGGSLSAEEVRHVARYFPRHAHDNLKQTGEDGGKPSAGYVAWLLWGGDEGRKWSENLVERLDKQEADA
ncbi:DNA-binding protein [Deinococcus sonorensis]|uniref:DNA-binding protein n=2 Tax=Deinococcus sonorensis TaxID=309891 RepID=A0AAU7UBV7_9DEIO